MSQTRATLVAAIAVILGAAAQHSLANRFSIWGTSPDFSLVLLCCFALRFERAPAAAYGFFSGLFAGALATANLGHYVASRTICGFLMSWSKQLRYELGGVSVAVAGFISTLVAEGLWMFFAAPHDVVGFLTDTIRSALYNGLLAVPVYFLLRRILPIGPRID